MLKINSSLNLKIIYNLFFIIDFILTIGFLNSSWLGLFAWMILFMCIYAGSISFNKRNWILIISITIFSLCVKNYIKTPYILEGSNVFIGGDFANSIFKKKTTSCCI